jgi:hypothetical protein
VKLDPTDLIKPFTAVQEALSGQMNAWSAAIGAVTFASKLPGRLTQIQDGVAGLLGGPEKVPFTIGWLIRDAKPVSESVNHVLLNNFEALGYPLLVGSWSILEAAIDDLVVQILERDPDAVARALSIKSIKPPADISPSSREYFEELCRRLQQNLWRKGMTVVEFHKALLGFFGAPLEYPRFESSEACAPPCDLSRYANSLVRLDLSSERRRVESLRELRTCSRFPKSILQGTSPV